MKTKKRERGRKREHNSLEKLFSAVKPVLKTKLQVKRLDNEILSLAITDVFKDDPSNYNNTDYFFPTFKLFTPISMEEDLLAAQSLPRQFRHIFVYPVRS